MVFDVLDSLILGNGPLSIYANMFIARLSCILVFKMLQYLNYWVSDEHLNSLSCFYIYLVVLVASPSLVGFGERILASTGRRSARKKLFRLVSLNQIVTDRLRRLNQTKSIVIVKPTDVVQWISFCECRIKTSSYLLCSSVSDLWNTQALQYLKMRAWLKKKLLGFLPIIQKKVAMVSLHLW